MARGMSDAYAAYLNDKKAIVSHNLHRHNSNTIAIIHLSFRSFSTEVTMLGRRSGTTCPKWWAWPCWSRSSLLCGHSAASAESLQWGNSSAWRNFVDLSSSIDFCLIWKDSAAIGICPIRFHKCYRPWGSVRTFGSLLCVLLSRSVVHYHPLLLIFEHQLITSTDRIEAHDSLCNIGGQSSVAKRTQHAGDTWAVFYSGICESVLSASHMSNRKTGRHVVLCEATFGHEKLESKNTSGCSSIWQTYS